MSDSALLHPYLAVGLFLLIVSAKLVKKIEGSYFSACLIFLVAFFFHAYLNVYIRYGSDIYFNTTTFRHLALYNILCNIMLIMGMVSYYLTKGVGQRQNIVRPFFTNTGFYASFFLVLFVFLFVMAAFFITGRFTTGKGAFSYGGGGVLYRVSVAMAYVFYAIVPALALSSVHDSDNKIKRFLAFASFLMVGFYSLSQFGRQTIMFVGLVFICVFGIRVRRIRKIEYIMAFLAVVLISAISMFRALGQGIVDVNSSEIAALTNDQIFSFDSFFNSIGKILPGQAVFSNVIEIMDNHNFFYGVTYFESALRVFLPSKLVDPIFSPTPAFWYKSVYLPWVQNQGFDFSMVAESYMNFYWFGILVFLFLGAFVAYLSKKIRVSRRPIAIIWSAIMVVNLIVGLRNDSAALFSRSIYFILPYLVMSYLVFKPRYRWRLKNERLE